MSADGDVSKGSGTDEGPDEFDSVVLDEDFIKRGISEQSLRRYQVVREQRWERPSANRTPGSGPSAPGAPSEGGATAEMPTADPTSRRGRGGSDQDRLGPGSTGHRPNAHLGAGESFSSNGFEPGRPRSTGLLVGAAALVVALVVLTGLINLGRGSAGSAGSGNTPLAAQAGPGGGQNVPLTPSVPAGSCFNLPSDSTATNMTVTIVTCSVSHQYELVDLEQGTGANNQYPTQATWTTSVYDQCSNDLQTYTGQSAAKWPSGLYPAVIPPTKDSWAKGNRTIYCVAALQSPGTGSVRALGSSGSTPTN
jgi:hypothetical protein